MTKIIPVGFAERLRADRLRSPEDALAQQIDTGIELEGRRKDGSQVPVEIGLTPINTSQGQFVLASVIDITERKKTEKQLRDQALILDLANDSIFIRDSQDRVTYWNEGAQRLYGWSKDEALGRVTHTLLKTHFPQPLADIQAQLLAKGHWHGELVHTRRDASVITVASTWTLRCDDANQVASVLELNHDITARKRADAELLGAQRSLERHVAELAAANKGLAEKNEEVVRSFANGSHPQSQTRAPKPF